MDLNKIKDFFREVREDFLQNLIRIFRGLIKLIFRGLRRIFKIYFKDFFRITALIFLRIIRVPATWIFKNFGGLHVNFLKDFFFLILEDLQLIFK